MINQLTPGVKVNNRFVHDNPTVLFTQLVALGQRDENIVEKFSHELTREPTSLFRHGMIRNPSKSKLRNYLLCKLPSLDRGTYS